MQPDQSWRSRRQIVGRPNRPNSYFWEWIVFGCAALLVIAMFLLALHTRYFDGRIAPNVVIQGIPVGGLGIGEARQSLEDSVRSFQERPITLRYEDRVWSPTAEEIGVRVRIDVALVEAFTIGRKPNIFESLQESHTTWRDGRTITLTVTFDDTRMQNYLQGLAQEIDRNPMNASMKLQKNTVIVQTEQSGSKLVIDTAMQQVKQRAMTLAAQELAIPVVQLEPAIRERSITPVRQQLERLLAQPVTISIDSASRTYTPSQVAELIEWQPTLDDLHSIAIPKLNLDPIQIWLNELAPGFVREPTEPRLRFVDGHVQIDVPGTIGTRLDVAAAMTKIEAGLWDGEPRIAVELTPVLPRIREETLASLGIVELVAEGKSDFSGSAPYRIQNIKAGAAQMNQVLIPPGASFSFNQQVGAIDQSNGFTQGYAIISGRTQLEWGGGVCQVSTTVFRAAFWAGLPIAERNQHSFRIRWYEVYEPIGMDAAIFTGSNGYDLQFVNDTGNYLLMQTNVNIRQHALTVYLYGTKPNREVEQTAPEITNQRPPPEEPRYVDDPDLPPGTIKQTDTKRDGMDVRIGRIVRQNGQIVRTDTFVSKYQPWPDIFALGPGASPPTPTPIPSDPVQSPVQPAAIPTPVPTDLATPQEGSSLPTPTPIP